MKWTVTALILAAGTLPAATLVKSLREGNSIFLPVSDGVEFQEIEIQGKLRPGCWFYDASNKNLHVRIVGCAGGDEIINISF